jgi:hypothetical protein
MRLRTEVIGALNLRTTARSTNRRLSELALDVVEGSAMT